MRYPLPRFCKTAANIACYLWFWNSDNFLVKLDPDSSHCCIQGNIPAPTKRRELSQLVASSLKKGDALNNIIWLEREGMNDTITAKCGLTKENLIPIMYMKNGRSNRWLRNKILLYKALMKITQPCTTNFVLTCS